jgi:lipopolysaccharide export system protein LptA
VPPPSFPDLRPAPRRRCQRANALIARIRARRALAAIALAFCSALYYSRASLALPQDTSTGTNAPLPVEQPPPTGEVTIPAVANTPSAVATGGGNPAAASSGTQPAAPEAGTTPVEPKPAAPGISTVTRKAADSTDAKGPNASPFSALASPNAGPLHIQSDSLSVDYKKNSAMWKGHVHAARADGQLTSDSLKVIYGKDFHELQNMIASGNVRISRGTQWSTSNQAVLDQAQQTVVLTGDPIVHDGNDQIAGSRITVYLKTGESVVEGAKAVIFPRQAKTRDNGVSADHGK